MYRQKALSRSAVTRSSNVLVENEAKAAAPHLRYGRTAGEHLRLRMVTSPGNILTMSAGSTEVQPRRHSGGNVSATSRPSSRASRTLSLCSTALVAILVSSGPAPATPSAYRATTGSSGTGKGQAHAHSPADPGICGRLTYGATAFLASLAKPWQRGRLENYPRGDLPSLRVRGTA